MPCPTPQTERQQIEAVQDQKYIEEEKRRAAERVEAAKNFEAEAKEKAQALTSNAEDKIKLAQQENADLERQDAETMREKQRDFEDQAEEKRRYQDDKLAALEASNADKVRELRDTLSRNQQVDAKKIQGMKHDLETLRANDKHALQQIEDKIEHTRKAQHRELDANWALVDKAKHQGEEMVNEGQR